MSLHVRMCHVEARNTSRAPAQIEIEYRYMYLEVRSDTLACLVSLRNSRAVAAIFLPSSVRKVASASARSLTVTISSAAQQQQLHSARGTAMRMHRVVFFTTVLEYLILS